MIEFLIWSTINLKGVYSLVDFVPSKIEYMNVHPVKQILLNNAQWQLRRLLEEEEGAIYLECASRKRKFILTIQTVFNH